MVLIVLFFWVLLLLLIVYNVFNKDFMSPSFLLVAGYLLSIGSTMYNIRDWNVSIGIQTFLIYFVGIMAFVVGEALIKTRVAKNKRTGKVQEVEYISVNGWKYFLVIFACVFVLILTYKEVVRIANLNFASWGNLAYNYKTNVINGNLEGASLSSLVQQANKITKGFAFVFLYIFINNFFADRNHREHRKNWINLIPGILFAIQCVIKGGRFQIVAYIISAVFLYYFFWKRSTGWSKVIPIKYLMRVIIGIVIVVMAFWFSRELVGRMSKDNDLMGYVTRYFGGGAALLELYLRDTSMLHDAAVETFAGMVTSLNKLGFTLTARASHEFRAAAGITIGNAYSALRNYYHDYGIMGVAFFNFLLSCIFSSKYYKLKSYTCITYNKAFSIILYATLIYTVFFQFFTDYFFARLSIGFIIELLIMRICFWFTVKLKISIGRR